MSKEFRARLLSGYDRAEAVAMLRTTVDENLVLMDFVDKLGRPLEAGDVRPEICGAFVEDRLVGIALLRPCITLSYGMSDDVLEVLLPYLRRVPSGLMKSDRCLVEPIWKSLEAVGRRASIDRIEIAYRLRPEEIVPARSAQPGVARPARAEDLDDLVHAARASLWEEARPDPAEGDPAGFRRWVKGRLARARIVSDAGRIAFVAYADVRRPEGWLVQGVYTWPEVRRRGFARRGMDFVIREAFAFGAAHVQLAVVDGNERASALYRELGFEPFAELRTILFA
jgi:ribosomal protein S18 acetylase RimI-like enzyme